MRKLSFILIAVAALSPAARADSVGACPASTNLQALINLGSGGCISGNILFTNFSYSVTATGGAFAPTAAMISVLTGNFLTFAGPWNVGIPGQINVQSLDFTISWIGLALNGTTVGGSCVNTRGQVTGDPIFGGRVFAYASVSSVQSVAHENVSFSDTTDCVNGFASPDASGVLVVQIGDNYSLFEVSAGPGFGFQPPVPTPEPTSLTLMAGGLGCLLAKLGKRKA